MAHDAFISYSSKDKPAADAVCATLESRGIRCWIAPRDVLPGEEYAAALVNAIHESRLLVLVFSAGANQSSQVLREVERAVSRGLPILPLRIEDVPPSAAMEYYISSRHWLDALTPPLELHLVHLADTVTLLLSRLPDSSAPPAPMRAVNPVPPIAVEEPLAPPSPPHAPQSPPPEARSIEPPPAAAHIGAEPAPSPSLEPAPKPFLQRSVVLGLGAFVLVAIVIAMIANSGHQENTGANNSYTPAPIITPEKKSSADSPAPVITPEKGSSTESNAPNAVTDAHQPTIPPGPIMIGNVDVSHFAGIKPGDMPERVAAHFGRPTADHGNRKIYLKWLTVDFENGGAKAVHLNYWGWNRVYARLGFVNDDVMTLLSYNEARAIERLGEPQRHENGDGGLLVSWSFADGRSELGWLQFKYGEGPNTSPNMISVTW